MLQNQATRMQRLTVESRCDSGFIRQRRSIGSIKRIAQQRQPHTCQMHTDLMRATCFQTTGHPTHHATGYAGRINKPHACFGRTAALTAATAELNGRARIATDGTINVPGFWRKSQHNGPVFASYGACLKLAKQIRTSRLIARNHHQSRRFLIQTVHNARAAHARQFRIAEKKSV